MPRNFCIVFLLNILVAGPISRVILRKVQASEDKNNNNNNLVNA